MPFGLLQGHARQAIEVHSVGACAPDVYDTLVKNASVPVNMRIPSAKRQYALRRTGARRILAAKHQRWPLPGVICDRIAAQHIKTQARGHRFIESPASAEFTFLVV